MRYEFQTSIALRDDGLFHRKHGTIADTLMSRQQLREQLLLKRLAATSSERSAWDVRIAAHLREYLLAPDAARFRTVGAYWPIRNEPNLNALLLELESLGYRIGLPAIVASDKPLRFLHWHSEQPLVAGTHGIPVPQQSLALEPELLLVPCLGFSIGASGKRYRLGYGGGYYDRTLAALQVPAIGIAYGTSRVEFNDTSEKAGFDPEQHDREMTAIITEAGVE